MFVFLQDLNFNKFIDVDNTVIKPSPQRVRNILTLDEKIAVIKAYDQRPMYKKVARMFNCSWEQIKNIITNRVAIMEFYEAAKTKTRYEAELEDEESLDVRQRKIKFLGECVYECVQRLQYHAKVPITEELIRTKALEFLDVLRIPNFAPTKKWINLWKATYNITLCNKTISIHTEPQFSLEIKDIMTYCTKAKTSKCLLTKFKKNDIKNVEYEAKRLRKLNFLQEALKEYLLRVKFHHKSMKLSTNSLHQVARDFNEILKVQDFEPTDEWIENFRKQHESEKCLSNTKRPPLSLDLKDILSYCSRMQNKTKDNAVTLAPKETALQMRILPKYPAETGLKFQQNPIIYLDEENGPKEVKPDLKALSVVKPNLEQPPPLKIRKIESINNDPQLQLKVTNNNELRQTPLITITPIHRQPAQEPITKPPPKTLVFIQKVDNNVPNEKSNRPPSPPANVKIKEENFEDTGYILPTNAPPLKIEHVQHLNQLPSTLSTRDPTKHLPHSSSPVTTDGVELPRHVTSFKDVLLLLKPLEEYAMLKENYRAIGLITQLEEVLKNQPESNNADEEFIV